MADWFKIENIEEIDSPALLIYPARIIRNIELVKEMVDGDCSRLRPHVKTNKITEVCQLMRGAGIDKFKCATIAEAEMLGLCKASDVLLAYQPVGPKIQRLINLSKIYTSTKYSCLIDNIDVAREINSICSKVDTTLSVYIDLNVGMNRTGILPKLANQLISEVRKLERIHIAGFHAYDGHIHDPDFNIRKEESDKSYKLGKELLDEVQPSFSYPLTLVIGGTPSFSIHAKRSDIECSPGTFVFWDQGYRNMLPEMAFDYAAVLISRVISVVDKHHICIDLGYKSVAAESPLPRVYFLNAMQAKPIAQSEEHLVLEVDDSDNYKTGDVLYGIPKHICPTVALYDRVFVTENNKAFTNWKVIARDKIINH